MPSMISKEMVNSSGEDAPVIVVSIAAIADQADLSPANLTGSLTVNGVTAIPDAWAWRVNGATTGIGDATDPTTVFIPTTGGTYVATLAASIYGEWRYAEQEAFVVGSGLLKLSIDAISDQSTLNPISFNSTASGGVGTKTYSWLVNGSTSGLSSATAADPTFTPTVAGEHTAVCTVTDEAGQTKTATRSFTIGTGALSVSIAAVSDQLDLSAATLDSTVSNAVGSVTYAWTVDGATTGLSSSTAADPTFTPTGAGTPTAVVTVTDAAGQTAKAAVTWRVGTTTGWVCVWSTSGITDHDFLVTATKVHNGVTIKRSHDGTAPTVNRFASGVLEVDTVVGTGNAAGIVFPPVSAVDNVADRDVCIIMGVGSGTLNTNNDAQFVAYVGAGGAFCFAEAIKSAGVQNIYGERSGVGTAWPISGGAQARVVGLHLSAQRVGFRPLRGTVEWSGYGPEPDSLTVAGGTPSGWHVTADKATSATTDAFAPNNNVGASEDTVQVKGRAHNGAAYSIAGISYWVRYL